MENTIKLFLDKWEKEALKFYKIARADYLNKKSELSYIDLQNYTCNKYGKGNYILIKDRYQDINAIILKEKTKKYNDLIKSIEKKAGKIEKAIKIDIDTKSGNLNGIIKGELNTVSIETIFAGGYNIQRLHYRTIIKVIK